MESHACRNTDGPSYLVALMAGAVFSVFERLTDILFSALFCIALTFLLMRHLENDFFPSSIWHEPRCRTPSTRAAAAWSTRTPSLYVSAVYKSIFFTPYRFLSPSEIQLSSNYSSSNATGSSGRGWDGGSALAAKPSSCRMKQIRCSTWPSEFSKLGFLRKCCLCSHGVFLCVPVHFDLSISFFQRNFKTSNTEIPW